MSRELPSLWVVDDDEPFRRRLSMAMEDRGFEVQGFSSADAALAALGAPGAEAAEYVVVDLRMPGASGLELLRALRQHDAHTRVVVLTGYGTIPTAVEATRLGATGYLTKPTDADAVLQALTGTASPGLAEETPSLARAEWEYIQRVLADAGQNVTETARRLGLHRRTLQRKLQKRPPSR